jgi:cytoskeletal protein CcmA (bactofilin family)
LSASNGNDRHPKPHTDTLIGVGLRLSGNIACNGVLRIEGEVHGDASCDADTGGTVFVAGSGSVCGAIRAPHIIVAGSVLGPLDASESIEIQPGANVAGDVLYRAIHIHPGGVIQGALRTMGAEDPQRTGRRQSASATSGEAGIAPAAARSGGGMRETPLPVVRIVAAVALCGVIATAAFLYRGPEPAAPPAAAPPPPAASTSADTAVRQEDTGTAAARTEATENRPAPEPAPQASATDTEKVVAVQGVNPGKPGGVFSVVGREPSVLIRKKRDEVAEGTRIEIPQGSAASIPFAPDEIFRVVQGRDVEIFYQGRKVGPKTIESGAWISFVPQSSGATAKREP